jgi:hypothetical protein
MLFFSKNKNIVKCAILLFMMCLSGVVLNTDNTHASDLSAFFTWNTNTNADGRDILDSDSKSMQMLAELYVQGADDSGFTVSIHAKNDTTSLVNEEKFVNDEIKSISENLTLDNFKGNNWGFSTDGANYQPIPDKNHPKLIANQDSRMVKTYYAIKLNENIKPANYKNTVVYSVVSNQIANLPSGIDFNKAIKEIAGGEENVVHIKSSNTIPEGANVKNIAANADVKGEFKIWYEPSEKTVYYWTSTKYAYLNENSEKTFDGFSNLESIDTTQLNASFATTTANMFSKNPKLKTLNFGKYIFNTEKVTDMHEMFADTGLEEIPVNNYVGPSFFDTKNVVNMSGMFARSRQLRDIRFVENMSMTNAEDLSYMFYGLNGREFYYIGTAFGSNTKKVKKLDYIFATDQENKIKRIEVEYWGLNKSIWDTSSVESYEGMFAGRTNYGDCGNGEIIEVTVSDLTWLRAKDFSHNGYFCAFDHL